jgi:hypothetical protein
MNPERAESDQRVDGGMPSTFHQAGGGSIGAKETDVSKGHAVCSRDDHGPTEPGTPEKSPPKTAREFQRAMRELGYSRREACAIASRGFKGLAEVEPEQPDLVQPASTRDMSEVVALLRDLATQLSKTDIPHA